MKHYYSRSESLCGRTCSVSENALSKDTITRRCGTPKNYNTYHLLIPNRVIQREKDRSQRSDDLYAWQKSNACKCRCSKSFTRFAEKCGDTNFETPNWKCKQLDRNYIRKSLVSGLKDMGIRCLEDYNPKAEVFILANHSQSPFLTNSSICPKPLHAYDVKKRPTNIVRPNVPYNCRSKKLKNIELELRYQAFKACIVGKLDRKYWKKNRPIDQQHLYKTLVKCGDLVLQKHDEGTAENNKHQEINNIAVQNHVYVDGELIDVENYENNIAKVNEDIHETSQWKATDPGERTSTEYVIANDGEAKSDDKIVSSKDLAQEKNQLVNLATNEMETDLSEVDAIKSQDISNVILQEGELNENMDMNDIDLFENSTINPITSSQQDLPIFEGVNETNEATENVEAIEYKEPDEEIYTVRKIENTTKPRKSMEDPIQYDEAIIQKSHKPMAKISDTNSEEKDDSNDENANPATNDEDFQQDIRKKSDSSEEIFDSPFIDENDLDGICNKMANVILSRLRLFGDSLNKLIDIVNIGDDGECKINELENLNVVDLLTVDEFGKETTSSSLKTQDYLKAQAIKGHEIDLDANVVEGDQVHSKPLEKGLLYETSSEVNEKDNFGIKAKTSFEDIKPHENNFESYQNLYQNSIQKPDIQVNERLLKSDFAGNKDKHPVSSREKEGNRKDPRRGQKLETVDENRKKEPGNFKELPISTSTNETQKIDSKTKANHQNQGYKKDLPRGQKLETVDRNRKKEEGNFQEFPISDGTNETQKIDSKNKANPQNPKKLYKEKAKEMLTTLRPRGSKQSNDDTNNRFINFQGKNKITAKVDISSPRKQKLTTLNPSKSNRVQSLMKVYKPQNISPKPDFIYGDFEKIKLSMSNVRVKNPCAMMSKDFPKHNLQIQPTCILTYTLSPKNISHKSEFKQPVKSYCNLITNSAKCQTVNACFNRPSIPICKSLNIPNNCRPKVANFVPTFTQKKIYDIPKLYGTTCLVKPQDYCIRSVPRCISKVR